MNLREQCSLGVGALTVLSAVVLAVTGTQPVLAVVVVVSGAMLTAWLWRRLSAFERVTLAFEALARGELGMKRLEVDSDDEFARLAMSFNQMVTQLRGFSEEADELAQGYIGVRQLEDKVLKKGLSEVDIPLELSQGELSRSFTALTNQLRRLTIQVRIIARDNLSSTALDERLPGELGESMSLMFENLRSLSAQASAIADGDLRRIEAGGGELAGAFNNMVVGLTTLVRQIMGCAFQVASTVEQISGVMREQEASASLQSRRVQLAKSTIEELLRSADRIARSAEEVFQVAERSHNNQRVALDHINTLISHMNRIDQILTQIQQIADRSDLLALNAGLEGVRAGEAGRGFTLIAREVRRLAETIKAAVEDIKVLVQDIRKASLESVSSSEEGRALLESTTNAALGIKVITSEQRKNTEEVTRAMEELAELIGRSARGTREVNQAVDDLVALSERLSQMVERFTLDEGPHADMEREDQRGEAMVVEGSSNGVVDMETRP